MSLSALEGGLLDLYEPDRITLLSFCRASNQFQFTYCPSQISN